MPQLSQKPAPSGTPAPQLAQVLLNRPPNLPLLFYPRAGGEAASSSLLWCRARRGSPPVAKMVPRAMQRSLSRSNILLRFFFRAG
jgi:hypothetical protein